MRKHILKALSLGLVGVLVIPVLVAPLTRPAPRSFEGVRLADADYEEIRFHNAQQDLRLAGMLFVPPGAGPFPAAVIIHGSGTSRRDSRWYLTLAHSLQQNGVVVLLPDKRGSESSEGSWRGASFEDLATDTLSAVSYLRKQERLAVSAIGVIGMSQGGHIAPLVADDSREVVFLVNFVGGAVPMHDQLLYEEVHNLRDFGVLPGLSNLIAYGSSWMIRNVAQKEFWEAIGNFDPVPRWRRLSIPCLVLYGELDTNVPSAKSAAIFRSLGKPNIDVRIYSGSGHGLTSPEGEGTSIIREDVLRDIREFVRAATTISAGEGIDSVNRQPSV